MARAGVSLRQGTRRLLSSKACTEFDYVVLGAGSAGCVVANRIVRDGRFTACLVEAGGHDRGDWDWWKAAMPAALTFNLADARRNWDYSTEPQAHLDGRCLHQPRGKVLGGSSQLNAMAYVRGHPLDFERWAAETAAGHWRYAYVLPYFRRAQGHWTNLPGDEDEHEACFVGRDGPLRTCQKRTEAVAEVNEAFVRAGAHAGYGLTRDANGRRQEGFGPMTMTVTPSGERASTAYAYIRPIEGAPNFDLRLGRQAVRVLVDGDRVVGAEIAPAANAAMQGEVETVKARREVILSLGAVGTPQILELSGIGDSQHLRAAGVPQVVHNAFVGANLQDHLEMYVQVRSLGAPSLFPYAATFNPHLPGVLAPASRFLFRRPWLAGLEAVRWAAGLPSLASSNHFEVGGFIRSRADVPHPDIQLHFIPGCVVGQLDFLPEHGYQAHVGTLRPTSRGSVHIHSADPRNSPAIDPGFLTTPEDRTDQRQALRLALEVLAQPAFDDVRGEPLSPTRAEIRAILADNGAADTWIRAHAHSAYHLSCSVAMGTACDAHGRLHGVRGCRVIDASAMPSMTSGNLNAPTITLAEKLVDHVLHGEYTLTSTVPASCDADVRWWEPTRPGRQREETPIRALCDITANVL